MKKNKDIQSEFLSILEQNIGIIIKISNVYTFTTQNKKELISDIIYELWKSYPKFKGDSKISTWFYRVVLNTALKTKRKRDNEKILFVDELFAFENNNYLHSYEDDGADINQLY